MLYKCMTYMDIIAGPGTGERSREVREAEKAKLDGCKIERDEASLQKLRPQYHRA